MIEAWLTGLADAYWAAAGGAPPLPRDLLDSVPLVLPVTIVTLPALAIERVERWLERHGVVYYFACGNRRLRGCLIARAGHGVIFVDGADAADERRFTLAHEIAHFLADYQRPRERAIRTLGIAITPVLDGLRLPTVSEQIDAALAACPLGVYTHLLEREGSRGVVASTTEEQTDRLAWELLAPVALLDDLVTAHAWGDVCERALRERFGLPAQQAARYARYLQRIYGPPPSFVDWLRP